MTSDSPPRPRAPPSLARRRREEEGDAERSAWLLGWIFATTAAIRARRFRRRNTALSQLADKSKMRDKSDANWQRLSETGGRTRPPTTVDGAELRATASEGRWGRWRSHERRRRHGYIITIAAHGRQVMSGTGRGRLRRCASIARRQLHTARAVWRTGSVEHGLLRRRARPLVRLQYAQGGSGTRRHSMTLLLEPVCSFVGS